MKMKAVFLLPLKGHGEVSIAGEESSPQTSQVKYRRDVTMLILHGKSAEVSFEFRSSKSEAGLMILPICCFLSNRLTFQSVRKQQTYFLPFVVYRFIPDLTLSSVSQEIMSGSRIFLKIWQLGTFGPVCMSTTENTPISLKDNLKM